MSASVSSPVSSTLHFQAQASAFASAASDRAPAPLATLRAAGAEAFARLGFPTTRSEDWKYTSVSSIANTPFVAAQDRAVGALGAAAKDAVDLGGVFHQAVHLGRDGFQLGNGQIGQSWLERAKLRAGIVGDHLGGGMACQSGIDVDKVLGFGAVFQPVDMVGQRVHIGFSLADLFRDRVGVIRQVDPALIGWIRL